MELGAQPPLPHAELMLRILIVGHAGRLAQAGEPRRTERVGATALPDGLGGAVVVVSRGIGRWLASGWLAKASSMLRCARAAPCTLAPGTSRRPKLPPKRGLRSLPGLFNSLESALSTKLAA
jgi:hypothetical protein